MNTAKHFLVVILGVAFLSAGCSWSVPASPGRNYSSRTPRTTAEIPPPSGSGHELAPGHTERSGHDPATEALYHARCGRCHVPFVPTQFSAEEWPWYVNKYAPRAGLFGSEREQVLAWLQANAR